jgi:phosphoesterase RecJ-like protein
MNHPNFEKLQIILDQRQRFLLISPAGPDGDSLGSIFALKISLEQQGKQVTCYSPEPAPTYLQFLPGIASLVTNPDEIDLKDYDCVIFCDGGDVKRIQLSDQLVNRDRGKTVFVNIDHHPTNTKINDIEVCDLSIISHDVASTTELVFHFMSYARLEMNKELATCLLTGILTDTCSFQNLATTATSLEVAAHLCSFGANIMRIGDRTIKNKSLGMLKLWGRALSRLSVDAETGVVSTAITAKDMLECGTDEEGAGGIANFLNNLDGAKAILVLREDGANVKGSYRTTREDMDVAALAKKYGGGGHKKAAGFTLPGRLVEDKGVWRVVEQNP